LDSRSNGIVYRLASSLVVPGRTKSSGFEFGDLEMLVRLVNLAIVSEYRGTRQAEPAGYFSGAGDSGGIGKCENLSPLKLSRVAISESGCSAARARCRGGMRFLCEELIAEGFPGGAGVQGGQES
jgi:hypothetical protein